jgi:hypothetical protein
MRPDSLFEVSRRVAEDGEPFDPTLREFLDTFYLEPAAREASMARQPLPLTPLQDAYLAATAEHLASVYSMRPPAWCAEYGMTLRQPHFAGGLESLKALLTLESPAAFRRRLLFVSKNALSRASQHVAEPPVTA